jgi:hypothetical protein
MHSAYRDLMLSRIRAAVDAATAVSGIKHHGLQGHLREILIRDVFRPLLPSNIGVGSGEIVSHSGWTSTQQDIVMHDKSVLPPFLLESMYGLFPIESVLYAIEVKTTLTPRDIAESHETFGQLAVEEDYWRLHCAECQTHYMPLIPVLFAFNVGMGLKTTSPAERYEAIRCGGRIHIGAICVVGHGYWRWDQSINGWRAWQMRYPLAEVVGLLAGVMNTYRDIAASRRDFTLGGYLIEDDDPMAMTDSARMMPR